MAPLANPNWHTSLRPRLRASVEELSEADRQFLECVLQICVELSDHPVCSRTLVFPIGDVRDAMDAMDDSPGSEWDSVLRRLRDHSLLVLHRTIPEAARQLGIPTIADGAGRASALSFPRRLWDAFVDLAF